MNIVLFCFNLLIPGEISNEYTIVAPRVELRAFRICICH
jgi:hypothetical protein